MNQDGVKALLLSIEPSQTEFSLIFTGKQSRLVNGLYKPATREILLHNRNFENDAQLVYTALHEYAHHLHCEKRGFSSKARAHSNEVGAIFHELLQKAEAKGAYESVFDTEPEFVSLTQKIRSSCLARNGELMLEFGRLMSKAAELCRRHRMRFEDYVDRALQLPRTTATSAMRASLYQVEPSMGWDAMKLVAGIKDQDRRSAAQEAFLAGKSPDSVRALVKRPTDDESPEERLQKERTRIEKTIRSLQERLDEIDDELSKKQA